MTARHSCVDIILKAERGMYHPEICSLVPGMRATTVEALRWACKTGHLTKSLRNGMAFYEATGKIPPLDGRGHHPNSQRALNLAEKTKAEVAKASVLKSPLAQALEWQP